MNNDGIPQNNDLVYVPANESEINLVPSGVDDTRTTAETWAQLNSYIEQDSYLSSRRGMYAERNGAVGEWFSQIDLRILQDFYLNVSGRRHTLQISLDFVNIGNLINNSWGVRTLPQNVSPLAFEGYDAEGEPLFSFPTTVGGQPLSETFIDDVSINSRWQMQLGIRYIFN
jgi:hypothetical protein